MSTLSVSVLVHMPPEQLFTHMTTLWESGAGLGDNGPGACVPASARLGRGFRLQWDGRRWGVAGDTELAIQDYTESAGWRAVSQPAEALSWTVRIAPLEDGAGLTCVLRYTPPDVMSRLREWLVGRRRRQRALRQLMDGWRTNVERQEALRRLRSMLAAPGSGSPGGAS